MKATTKAIRVPVWIVSLYHKGEYESTIGEPFAETDAKKYCESFNRITGAKWEAVAVESTSVANVPRLKISKPGLPTSN